MPTTTADPLGHPHIHVSNEEIGDGDSLLSATIDVSNAKGEVGRFWIAVRVVNGRPRLLISTEIGKDDNRRSRNVKIVGTFRHPFSPL